MNFVANKRDFDLKKKLVFQLKVKSYRNPLGVTPAQELSTSQNKSKVGANLNPTHL